ncbi:MAG: putative colanic acid biosynthesis acetyltransferase WcaF [Bryobacterales bacterium]|nr:putative colanic acid biosynthesis acetyltransferase WcaF [Bryobacterales bacterium]
MSVRLASFRNDWYSPGRSRLWQAVWFVLGCPLMKCGVMPFSGFRVSLLRLFGAQVGQGVVIKPGVRVKNPWRLTVGNDCWIGEDCWIDNIGDVVISDDVCLSQGAYLCTGNHDWSDTSFGLIVKPIRLERGSWVGARALIAPGVSLGQCAVAAAGSVVQKSVPAFEIHSGNPAAFVRRRKFSVVHDKQVAASDLTLDKVASSRA